MNPRYGLDPDQLLRYVIRPILRRADAWSPAAEVLVLGTGMTESQLRYIDQLDVARKPGPAYGIYQCEARTHEDYWRNYLCAWPPPAKATSIAPIAYDLAGMFSGPWPSVRVLTWNIGYATLMCRIHYLRIREPLPVVNDSGAMAAYHKRYYNTFLGATDVEKSIAHFEAAYDVVRTAGTP